jgi:hypothetical protein
VSCQSKSLVRHRASSFPMKLLLFSCVRDPGVEPGCDRVCVQLVGSRRNREAERLACGSFQLRVVSR